MQRVDDQFRSVFFVAFLVLERNAADAVATVQIEELGHAFIDWQPDTVCRRNVVLREGHDAGLGSAVRLCERIEQERRIVVLCPGVIIPFQHIRQIGPLIHVVGSGGIKVNFFKQVEIRFESIYRGGDVLHVFIQCFFRNGPGMRSSIHEEIKVCGVSTKAYVPCSDIVFLSNLCFVGNRIFDLQIHVADAVERCKNICHIRTCCQNDNQDNDQ